MAEIIARQCTLEVSDDGGSNYFPVAGCDDVSLSIAHDTIDKTDFDSNGMKENEYGESQYTAAGTFNVDEADSGQTKLHTASQNKTKVKARVRSRTASGAKQWVFDAKLNKFDLAHGRNAMVKGSIELLSSGAVVFTVQ
jgi:predicted secreted protein